MQPGDIPPVAASAEDQPANIRNRALPAQTECRVLVVDDNRINCEVAVQMLQKSGCHAEAANSGSDAIDMHARQRYDLILMDCQMPGLDGYQTTARIRAIDAGGRRTGIVGWTSTPDANERTRCLAAGMDDMTTKPIGRAAISEIIRRWATAPVSLQTPSECVATENGLAAVQQRFGAHFPELAALYQSDSLQRIAAMQNAAAAGNLPQIAAIAHVFGSSCASMGTLHLASLCRELETSCNAAITHDLASRLDEIQHEYGKTEVILKTLLQSGKL